MAERNRAQSSAAAVGEDKGLPGAGVGFASRSLDDSSLPVNFHGNLASAHNDEELLTLLQRAKTSKRPVSGADRALFSFFLSCGVWNFCCLGRFC